MKILIFNIKYDSNRECLFGNEFILVKQPEKPQSINDNDDNGIFNGKSNILFRIKPKEFKTISSSSFVLHGYDRNSEFNIFDLEVYDIELPQNDKYRKFNFKFK